MNGAPLQVLLIEDNPGDARLIRELVGEPSGSSIRFEVATTLAGALELATSREYDVALLDLSLPDSHGLETVKALGDAAPSLPIVVNSGLTDEAVAVESLSCGAQDYLFKGQGDGILIARALRYAIERKRTSERLSYLAHYDQLTGLANRFHFQERLAGAMKRARRNGTHVGLLLLDLDRFKEVNDVMGHASGDQLLTVLSRRLEKTVRDCDLVARLGGDEFTVIIEELTEPSAVSIIARKIEVALGENVTLDKTDFEPTASIGIATFPKNGDTVDDLMRAADSALYDAKERGRSQFCIYDESTSGRTTARIRRVSELELAVSDEQFYLVYHPQVHAQSLRAAVMEALLRWRHPSGQLVGPSAFIPGLEESGLIVAVGEWVIQKACLDCRSWREKGIPEARVSVNVALRQLKQSNFEAVVESACSTASLPPSALDLEVTEEAFSIGNEDCIDRLRSIRELGVRVCVDDFGTGYVNLSKLGDLPIDAIKVHQSFVRALDGSGNQAIYDALVNIGRGMSLSVVAEGVEIDQLERVQKVDDVLAQGFAISTPLGAADVVAWWQGSLDSAPKA